MVIREVSCEVERFYIDIQIKRLSRDNLLDAAGANLAWCHLSKSVYSTHVGIIFSIVSPEFGLSKQRCFLVQEYDNSIGTLRV